MMMKVITLVMSLTVMSICTAVPATAAASENNDQNLQVLRSLSKEDRALLEVLSKGWEDNWQEYLMQPRNILKITLGSLEDVEYLLWTRDNPDNADVIKAFNSSTVTSSHLDLSLPTILHFHGFADNGLTSWIINAKNELLRKLDCNVISVDYHTLVEYFYPVAVINVYKTGNLTAAVLDWLVSDYGLDLQKVEAVGHSLGAHVAGMTGLGLKTGTLARVTGLDPAGPLFYFLNSNHRISPKSADFVDVIHANSGSLLNGCLGLFTSLGHVDFYPNGGVHQPGCIRRNTTIEYILDMMNSCSHIRVTSLWVESIAPVAPSYNTFWAWPCQDFDTFAAGQCDSCDQGCLQMGYPAAQDYAQLSVRSNLNYYLRTSAESPYAHGRVVDSGAAAARRHHAGSTAALASALAAAANWLLRAIYGELE